MPSTLRRPDSQARMKLPGSAAIATTSSLLAVNRTCADSPAAPPPRPPSPSGTSRIGSAPCEPRRVRKVKPRSGTRRLRVRSTRCLSRCSASILAIRAVRLCSASRHSRAVAIPTSAPTCTVRISLCGLVRGQNTQVGDQRSASARQRRAAPPADRRAPQRPHAPSGPERTVAFLAGIDSDGALERRGYAGGRRGFGAAVTALLHRSRGLGPAGKPGAAGAT